MHECVTACDAMRVRCFYRNEAKLVGLGVGGHSAQDCDGAAAAHSAAAMDENEDEAGEKRRAKISLWRGPETKLQQASADTGEAEEKVFRKLDLQRHGDEGSLVPASHGTIDFVLDRDNDAPARFVVVSSGADAQSICKVMTDAWRLTRPSVILSVTGAATSLALDAQLEDAYVKGLANAAQSTRSWIITGGSDSGVMALTGKVMSSLGTGTPCIGIAPYGAVMYKEKLVKDPESQFNSRGGVKGSGLKVKYWKQDKPKGNAAIDANHTHFVLVDNDKKKSFGGEVEMRAAIEEHMAREAGGSKGEVPLVCLCVSGGPGTFDTLLEQLVRENMVLLLAESGGAAGAITQFIEAYREGFPQKPATDLELIELYAVALASQAARSPQPALTPPHTHPHPHPCSHSHSRPHRSVDQLATDKLISEVEQNKIKSQAKADATGKEQTVAHVLVAAATAQPPRIHFYRLQEGPFDKVRALPCPCLGLELRSASTRPAAMHRAYYMHTPTPCTCHTYAMLTPCCLLTTENPQRDHLVVSQHD